MVGDVRSFGALVFSALLHVALAVAIAASGRAFAAGARDQRPRPDAWSGDTFEVDALLNQAVVSPAAPATNPAAAAPPVPAAAVPAEPKASPRVRAARPAPAPARAAPAEAAPEGAAAVAGKREAASESRDERPNPGREVRAPAAGGGGAGAVTAETATAYGAAGQAAMERDLAKAFTRAIPAAISRDSIWSELELGPAGSARIEITIDEEGRIASAEPERPPPAQFRRLLERTLILLRRGRFALRRGTGAGSETLHLEATISEGSAKVDEFTNPRDPVQLGFEPPSAEKAGRAFFTLASGRKIEIRVKLVLPDD